MYTVVYSMYTVVYSKPSYVNVLQYVIALIYSEQLSCGNFILLNSLEMLLVHFHLLLQTINRLSEFCDNKCCLLLSYISKF